jgi:hypothetical protein
MASLTFGPTSGPTRYIWENAMVRRGLLVFSVATVLALAGMGPAQATYTSTLVGTTATVTGDASAVAQVTIGKSGGNLTLNGSPDWDSVTAGDQVATGKSLQVKLKVSGKNEAAWRKAGKLAITVTVTITVPVGTPVTVTQTVKIRAPRVPQPT